MRALRVAAVARKRPRAGRCGGEAMVVGRTFASASGFSCSAGAGPRGGVLEEHGGDFEKAWQSAHTPWDIGQPAPPLRALLQEKSSLIPLPDAREKEALRALVPGCGSGHDVALLAQHGFDVTGLDIAETALAHARSVIAASTEEDGAARARAHLQNADFFRFEGQFSLIFDYTFFCAIPYALRAAWGEGMARLLAKDAESTESSRLPSSRLVTLMFPVEPDGDPENGPPFPVTVDAYRSVLEPHGVELLHLDEESKHTIRPRQGREILGIWGWAN